MVRLKTIAVLVAAFGRSLLGGDSQYDNCTKGTVADIGNGRCDTELNVPSCGYDGGDCCSCSCVDSPSNSCSDNSFDCIFPDCGGAATSSEGSTCVEGWKSDGYCDPENHGPECDYDGGDCCECSCIDSSVYTCGINGFACQDPACFDATVVAEFPDCDENWLSIGDGYCDTELNVPSCGYDGGDCCSCSCFGIACPFSVANCLDPSAEDVIFECMPPPTTTPPCSAEIQQTWVVETSAQARAFAAAVNCSGGSFEVEWRGTVVVDEPIFVADRTVVAVTGADSGAVIDGNARTRLFTVVNAVLSLSSVNVSNGASIVGGAIAAQGSTLTLNRTNFVGNRATQFGGGVYVSNVSDVSCLDNSFVDNRAGVNGGAIYVSGRSVVSCGGSWVGNSFVDNSAEVDGGAMFVTGKSVVSCSGSWVGNAAGDAGGALGVYDESAVFWAEDADFVANTAGWFGGAMYVRDGSSVSWSASTLFENNVAESSGGAVGVVDSSLSWNSSTVFSFNRALASDGGALHIVVDSNVSWDGTTMYVNNTAGGEFGAGGALSVWNSSAGWRGSTSFLANEAVYGGGALYLENSNASWSGEFATVFDENRGGRQGGGIMAVSNSHISCADDATSIFSGNSAREYGGAISLTTGSSGALNGNSSFDSNRVTNNSYSAGGAIYMFGSAAAWNGLTSFTGNQAIDSGGAIYASFAVVWFDGDTSYAGNTGARFGGGLYLTHSTLSWDGEMELFNNTATFVGGGVVAFSSDVWWTGKTTVKANDAGRGNGTGGGFMLYDGSVLFWIGDTEFMDNTAHFGGAISLHSGSRASWNATSTIFHHNSADDAGGALLIIDSSEVSWSGDTEFSGNRALSGGALYTYDGSSVGWTGNTKFSSNVASADGGAVGSSESTIVVTTNSIIEINGSTTFSNNTSGANGGALALLGGWTVHIATVDVVFDSNHAGVSGGAVFVSGTGYGPTFSNVSFVSNSAQAGGAVSMMASGNLKALNDVMPPNPTTFDRCRFVDNTATATGGAIESASGTDAFVGSVFQGNTAGTSGGALRLAGTASVDNCSFAENISNDGGGAAVSNIGVILKIEGVSFKGNVFACPTAMFLDYNASGDPYRVACDGCDTTCDSCSFEEPPLVPMCTDVMEHAFSDGGTDTLEMLSIERGYWRATPSSEVILACYNADACLGGMTGTSGYCLEGYEGPYCSICSSGYTGGLGFTCSKCSNSAGGIVLAAVFAVMALVVVIAIVVYVMSGKAGTGKRGIVERLGRYIPLQSVKIVIVAWQILTQFTAVVHVTYPAVYQRFLDGLDVFNFDLSWVLSAGCVLDIDFHHRLLLSTISPTVAVLFLGGTYAVAARIHHGDAETLQIIWNKHMSMVLLLTFLVYSSVSSTLFKTFACEELDDRKNYLRADYRIECNSSEHKAFQVYAGLMIVLYTVGIPFLYGVLLFRDRDELQRDQVDRGESARISSTSDLWKPYRPSVFYYEVIECGRRVTLAGVVVFIYPNTAAQIAVTLVMAFVFVVVSEALAPYGSRWDTWLNRMGHAVVYMSMYVALLLKVDVSDERGDSQKVFEAVLVAAHAGMILAIVTETLVLACALRVEQREAPSPRFGVGKALFRGRETVPAGNNPFAGDIYDARVSPVS
eukprot:g8846.t1